jgi:hypothetical protein
MVDLNKIKFKLINLKIELKLSLDDFFNNINLKSSHKLFKFYFNLKFLAKIFKEFSLEIDFPVCRCKK